MSATLTTTLKFSSFITPVTLKNIQLSGQKPKGKKAKRLLHVEHGVNLLQAFVKNFSRFGPQGKIYLRSFKQSTLWECVD